TAERFADGLTSADELNEAWSAASRAMVSLEPRPEAYPSRSARAWGLVQHHASFAAGKVAMPQVPDEDLVFHVVKAVAAVAEQRLWACAELAGADALAARGQTGSRAARSAAKVVLDAASRSVGAARRTAEAVALDYQRAVLRDLLGPFPSPLITAACDDGAA